jgi:predicted metal-binding protein
VLDESIASEVIAMEKILIIGCKRAMDDVCIGCSRCLVGFNRKEGSFNWYADEAVELMGLLNCGDCPGAAIVPRLAQVSLWNKPMGEQVTKVHIAPCVVDHCPYSETLIKKIKAKAGVEVVVGTHPYIPENIFAS